MTTKTEIIAEAFKTLRAGMISEAKAIISENYPFKPLEKEGRTYREHQKMKIFLRDGFIDRYSGERLVFPPVLRIMSSLMPDQRERAYRNLRL